MFRRLFERFAMTPSDLIAIIGMIMVGLLFGGQAAAQTDFTTPSSGGHSWNCVTVLPQVPGQPPQSHITQDGVTVTNTGGKPIEVCTCKGGEDHSPHTRVKFPKGAKGTVTGLNAGDTLTLEGLNEATVGANGATITIGGTGGTVTINGDGNSVTNTANGSTVTQNGNSNTNRTTSSNSTQNTNGNTNTSHFPGGSGNTQNVNGNNNATYHYGTDVEVNQRGGTGNRVRREP